MGLLAAFLLHQAYQHCGEGFFIMWAFGACPL
jgi:hypothetical protein